MSDDENVKKDKSTKSNNNDSEPITEETSVEKEEIKTEEEKVEATVEETTAEPEVETPVEEEPKVEETPVEEPPIVEAASVEEPVSTPEPQVQNTTNVVQPDQVVNNNNYENNNNYANTNNTTNNSQEVKTEQPKKKGMAIWTLVLAVIGLFTGFILIGGLFDLIAIILAIVVLAKKKDGKGLAITGLIIAILSIIGTIIWSIFLIPILAVFGLSYGLVSNYDDVVSAGEDIYGYATNIIEDVNREYNYGNYVFDTNDVESNSTTSNRVSSNTVSNSIPAADEHNDAFDTYIGTGNSSLFVHTFLLSVKTNNLTTTRAQKMGVCYIASSTSYKERETSNTTTIDGAQLKENGIYLDHCKSTPTETELDAMNFTCNSEDISTISKHLNTNKKYTIRVANSKEYDSTSASDTGFKSGIAKGSTGGLYDSGYYRLIYIYEEN